MFVDLGEKNWGIILDLTVVGSSNEYLVPQEITLRVHATMFNIPVELCEVNTSIQKITFICAEKNF